MSGEPVTRAVAEWAAGLVFDDLPSPVVSAAKRFLLDSLACALGGSRQPDVSLLRQTLDEIAGRGEATVLVTGEKVDPVSAVLLNSLMIRVMDYNDVYWRQDPSHPSDLIPVALAAAERSRRPGRDVLLGIVIAYEVEQRLCEVSFPGLREVGWHHATLTAVAAPVAAGRVIGLDARRIQNAIGISASRHCTTGAVTAGGLTMMKNTVDPLAVQSGMLAALLAERGYTGPGHVLDGTEGFSHVFPTEWRWPALTADLGSAWRILDCGMKAYPTEALTHTPISALLELVREHDLRPEQVEAVTVHSLRRAADILADPSKYDPRSRETADHSLPYVVAAAIVDREVTPRQLTPERIGDPVIRAQLPKVKVVADPEIEAAFPALQRACVVVDLVGGGRLERQLDFPRGDPRNPLTDAELAAKMRSLAKGVATAADLERMTAAVRAAESFDDARELASRFTVTT